MPSRYFQSERANYSIPEAANAKFDPVGIFGGRMLGILETADPVLSGILERATSHGITELSMEDYNKLVAQKKTPHNSTPSPPSNPDPVPRGPALAAQVGVESAGVSPSAESFGDQLKTLAECISIGPVNSPDAIVAESDRVATVTKKTRKRAA